MITQNPTHVQKDKRDNSGIHFQKCVFVGYPTEYKAWQFYNPVTRKMVVSERAIFDERYFPGHSGERMKSCPDTPPSSLYDLPTLADPPTPKLPPVAPHSGGVYFDDSDDAPPPSGPPEPPVKTESPTPSPNSSPSHTPTPSPGPSSSSPPDSPIGVAARRKFRGQQTAHHPPTEWWKVKSSSPSYREPTPDIPDSDSDPHEDAEVEGESSDDELLLRPPPHSSNFTTHEVLSSLHSGDPRSLKEALSRFNGEQWREAAVDEINSLLENDTWEVVDPPQGCKPLRPLWNFTTKLASDGTVERLKARLVADGSKQKYGVDYVEVFAPHVQILHS
jgi:hypothetical protein